MSQQKKHQLSGLLTMGELTRLLPPVAVNSAEANAKPSIPSPKRENTPTSTQNLSGMSLNPTENERENALLAAGIFASTLPALLKSGLVRRAKNKLTGEVVLVFPSTVWTPDLKLKG